MTRRKACLAAIAICAAISCSTTLMSVGATLHQQGTGVSCPASTLPITSSVVRANLRQIAKLLFVYANEYGGFPATLSSLVTKYPGVLNPSVFWNPGDADACPDVISSDQPNAAGSTQVSFRYFGSNPESGTTVVLQDDTLAQNAGVGVHALLADGTAWFFSEMESTPAPAAPGRDKLEAIGAALNAYAIDHGGEYPPVLSALYPVYVPDPLLFWNPGDRFPRHAAPPTRIDNDTLNAPNSAQTSFLYFGAGRTTSDDPQAVLVQDNSPANNGGLVLNIRTIGSIARSYVANRPCESPLSCRASAMAGVRSIAMGVLTYANENMGTFPASLSKLVENGSVSYPDTFWNPGDSDPRPLIIDRDLPDQENSTQISYAYFGGSANQSSAAVVLQDNALENNHGDGLIVLTADATVEFFVRRASRNPDVEAAQTNLAQIGQALRAYAADHGGLLPDRLSILYPAYIASPAVFWNPGDSNPAPASIDDDKPNAARSAQISFHYRGAGRTLEGPPGLVLVSDNSAANNMGWGINVLTADGRVDFYSPESPACTSADVCTEIAMSKLRIIQRALQIYANDHDGLLPPALSLLYPEYVPRPTDFWDASDNDPPPATIDNDVPNAANSAQISYEYFGAGLNLDTIPYTTVLVRDSTLANHGGNGIIEVRRDRVRFVASRQVTRISMSGPDVVPGGTTARYTATATLSDGTTQDVTASADWTVASGQGAFKTADLPWWVPDQRGVYQAPPVQSDTPVTLKATYYGSGYTGHVATMNITVQPDGDLDGVPDVWDQCGSTVPGAGVDVTGCPHVFGDADQDGDVDDSDFQAFASCRSGPAVAFRTGCTVYDRDGDQDVDFDDFGVLQRCYSGSCRPADVNCAD